MDTTATIIEALARAPGIVIPLVREVPPGVLKRRPVAGKWSAHEHACHLALVHWLFFDRLDEMLASPAPVTSIGCAGPPMRQADRWRAPRRWSRSLGSAAEGRTSARIWS